MLGDDCYRLIHSDTPGEIINERWRFEVSRKNNIGEANPDNTMPVETNTNQFNDLYSNPR